MHTEKVTNHNCKLNEGLHSECMLAEPGSRNRTSISQLPP